MEEVRNGVSSGGGDESWSNKEEEETLEAGQRWLGKSGSENKNEGKSEIQKRGIEGGLWGMVGGTMSGRGWVKE